MPKVSKSNASKTVKLQINDAGGWRNVISFNAADDQQAASVMEHSVELAAIGKATLRIVADDGMQTALCRWNEKDGWHDALTREPLK